MRILHCYKIYRPEVEGGIPEVMSQLLGLRDFGDSSTILTARRRGWGRRYVLDGAEVRAVASLGEALSMPLAPHYPLVLAQAAKSCDVLALHAPFPLNDIGLALGVPDDVALVVHWHAEILGRQAIVKLLAPVIRHTLARADRIVVSDQSIIDRSEFLKPHVGKCSIIPYGVRPEEWSELDAEQARRAAELRARYPRLMISMGRLVPYKGYPVLLEAMREIDGHLVVIGDGSDREALAQRAAELGVADRVTFTGLLPRDDMKGYLHAARVFVLPSVTEAEAFGIVQIEAMSAGLPVVNTAVPTAVPKIARDGLEGLSVAPRDAGALAAAIRRLLDDPDLAARFGRAGRERVAGEYSQSVFLRRISAVYSSALSRRRGQPGRAPNEVLT